MSCWRQFPFSSRFGSNCLRILKLLLLKKHLEQDQVRHYFEKGKQFSIQIYWLHTACCAHSELWKIVCRLKSLRWFQQRRRKNCCTECSVSTSSRLRWVMPSERQLRMRIHLRSAGRNSHRTNIVCFEVNFFPSVLLITDDFGNSESFSQIIYDWDSTVSCTFRKFPGRLIMPRQEPFFSSLWIFALLRACCWVHVTKHWGMQSAEDYMKPKRTSESVVNFVPSSIFENDPTRMPHTFWAPDKSWDKPFCLVFFQPFWRFIFSGNLEHLKEDTLIKAKPHQARITVRQRGDLWSFLGCTARVTYESLSSWRIPSPLGGETHRGGGHEMADHVTGTARPLRLLCGQKKEQVFFFCIDHEPAPYLDSPKKKKKNPPTTPMLGSAFGVTSFRAEMRVHSSVWYQICRRLLDKQQRVEAIAASLEGADPSQKEEVEGMITPPEKTQLEKIQRMTDKCVFLFGFSLVCVCVNCECNKGHLHTLPEHFTPARRKTKITPLVCSLYVFSKGLTLCFLATYILYVCFIPDWSRVNFKWTTQFLFFKCSCNTQKSRELKENRKKKEKDVDQSSVDL